MHIALNTDFYSPNLYSSVLFELVDLKQKCVFYFPTVHGVQIIAVVLLGKRK